ncbi:hypothetical protein LTR37_006764 [Vermiconidia calcicola]|uniref:Uncharacterized protein n=1 Tax=Vermiconidia calcicola TaxID=1690605 RepID=A0ACC3NFH8_9PEZI|nr:hypothetical protein LTR37_006764 [Vermiconidia calcicola]
MDTPFDVTAWRPTRVPKPGDRELSDNDLTSLELQLQEQTKAIYAHAYDPNTWLQRAKTLKELRYPELALGDAHKASALCRKHLNRLDDGTKIFWRLGHRMGFWMLDPDGPRDEEQNDMLEQYLVRLQSRAHQVEVNCMYFFPEHEEGRFRRRPYPWINESHRQRSDDLLDLLNQEFAENVANHEDDERPHCVVKRHAFGQSDDGKDTSDVLGVFAAKDIDAGEEIIVDKTRTWGCNGPGRNGDMQNLFGGKGCGDPIHPNDESDDAHLDLRWIRDDAGKQAATTLLNCRLLLCCIQDSVEHPLDHPLIARLTPTYREDKMNVYSLLHDFTLPNEALQRFGIDIFANHNFDTWVLFTIQARVLNNSCGDPIAECLNPLFCLFNHSCEPNVLWTTAEDHRTIRVRAARNLQEAVSHEAKADDAVVEWTLSVFEVCARRKGDSTTEEGEEGQRERGGDEGMGYTEPCEGCTS